MTVTILGLALVLVGLVTIMIGSMLFPESSSDRRSLALSTVLVFLGMLMLVYGIATLEDTESAAANPLVRWGVNVFAAH